jgi:two-component system cell cycle sensor histidine kinase PleC
VNIQSKTTQFIVLDTFFGLAWAGFVFAIYITAIKVDSFIIITALMIISGATMSSSALPKAVLGATLPIALSLALYFGLRQNAEGIALAIGILCAESFFLFVAGRFYKANLSGLVANADKESLLADLEIAKMQSDEARREAENANVAKSRFLAQMSHELRTPLNAILGFSEVIKDEMFGALGVPAYKEYANDINSSGQHLLSLINEILDLSRIESGKQELQEDSVTLSYIAEDAVHLLRVRAKNKGVEIVEQYEEEMPKLWADERAIRQIILNVMSNAIKFTPANGSVTVKIGWTASGGQYISIRDTGMGIPEDEIEEVLSNFGQGSNAMKSAEAGTGLGLPIVQGLVQMHGGTFTLKSKVGVGTEVISTFPATRVMETLGQIKSPSLAPAAENKGLNRLNIRKELAR